MNALVMYDHQTNTLWSQFLSKAVQGTLKDKPLPTIPATQTTWEAWLQLHPDTSVLHKGDAYKIDPYISYYENSKAGVHGQFNPDDRLYSKELVLGVNLNNNPKAYPLSPLSRNPIVHDTLNGTHILVFYDTHTGTALAFDRAPGDEPLTFRIHGEDIGARATLIDEQTNTQWSAFTGAAIHGELKGTRLQRLPSHLSFWFAWSDWNPQTQIWQPNAP